MSKDIIWKGVISPGELDRIVQMAWEDRTPFEAIKGQFGWSEQKVIKLMRSHLSARSFKMWRKRVSGRKTKHKAMTNGEQRRFKSALQREITHNKISKR